MSKINSELADTLPYHAVGETFSISGRELGQENDVMVKVVESDDCYECVFEKDMVCLRRPSIHGNCHSGLRKDWRNVKFVPVNNESNLREEVKND